MLIVGAKGFAKEVLELFHQNDSLDNIFFYDGIIKNPGQLYNKFDILNSDEQVSNLFEEDNRFVLGIGSPSLREKLAHKMIKLGGKLETVISPKALIGHFGTTIGAGCTIMSGAVLTNDIKVSEGVLINLNSTIGHDCIIGKFVEICPGANISGNVIIGDNVFIGTNVVIAPGCTIGNNAIIGAGSVVLKSIPENSFYAGNPAKLIRLIEEHD